MKKIHLLSEDEIRKIAAGEVVARPANVVKELLENSIDAGAKNIILQIKKGGKEEIVVQDDGDGMDEENLLLSILPHSTSKINVVEDLDSLVTFGFRGEALASISAVSEFQISSRPNDGETEIGKQLIVNFGQKTELTNVSHLIGTKIVVKNLFANTPVRKKFLKSNETESNQIWDIFYNLALAHKSVAFKFFEDDKLALNAPATDDLLTRAAQLFDFHLAQNLIPLFFEDGFVKIKGLISNLQVSRFNRSQIRLFVNNRQFKDSKIGSAVCQGYAGALGDAKFPVAILFFELSPNQIDVNVHPSKEEVFFLEHHKILQLTKKAVNGSLKEQFNQEVGFQKALTTTNSVVETGFADDLTNVNEKKSHLNKFTNNFNNNLYQDRTYSLNTDNTFNSLASFENQFKNTSVEPNENPFVYDLSLQQDKREAFFPTTFETVQVDFKDSKSNFNQIIFNENQPKFIGQLWKTFLLMQQNDKLILIDQHAASERIVFEEMKKNFDNLPKMKLLFPITLQFEASEVVILDRELEVFSKFGINLERIGKNTFKVDAGPPGVEPGQLEKIIRGAIELEVNGAKIEQIDIREKLIDKMHAEIACKTAIKAGAELSIFEMEKLWKKLQTTENRFQCIHGRPTIFEIDREKINKWFFRS